MSVAEMELLPGHIDLYLAYPDKISDHGLLQRYRSLLSEDEASRMSRLYHPRLQHAYLITRTLIRTSLSTYYPVEPAAWVFGANDYGKPHICYPAEPLAVRFNVSHTRGLIVCGVGRDIDIGVDVEDTHRSTRAGLANLSRYFSEKESRALNETPESERKQRFFDYWTLKESYIKARGMGLAIPLDKFSFEINNRQLTGFSVDPDLDDDARRWQFWRIPLAGRYQAAVAVHPGDTPFRIRAFNTVPLLAREPVNLTFL